MKPRYRLDDLGWAQFETLVQSLLKAHCGLTVEAWGGHADHGCDAWSEGPLKFPQGQPAKEGPFVFQAKFVEEANAAGANPVPALRKAVAAEQARIADRARRGIAPNVRQYFLLTNATVSASERIAIRQGFSQALPSAQVSIQDGRDLDALLDQHAIVRRSFPQLLSLRDIDELLSTVVNKDLLRRSSAARDLAKEVLPVFVPTSAYSDAWKILRKHHFVVLEGPPEMGKSAIAWMIALNRLCDGWEALVCDRPEDFLKAVDPEKNQVFVADDAFGRTEYDPSRGRDWETNLQRVHSYLDTKHWLVWTSRKHILERARSAMDLQGAINKFPAPAEVLVDTSKLTVRERAFILYRHGRAGQLESEARALVRSQATNIVGHEHFTPERIRRFVKDTLPDLGPLAPTRGAVSDKIRDAIRNPTTQMRKSFAALPDAHKWLLFAFLEANSNVTNRKEVKRLYERLCPEGVAAKFDQVCDELFESFLTEYRTPGRAHLHWMHPSYRDLVIEELSGSPVAHERFMSLMSIDGIKLAISDTGGSGGDRAFPLMRSANAWSLLRTRCLGIAKDDNRSAHLALIMALHSGLASAAVKSVETELRGLVAIVLSKIRDSWSRWALSSTEIWAFAEASVVAAVLEPMPQLQVSWDAMRTTPSQALADYNNSQVPDADELVEWQRILSMIRSYEPRFLKRKEVEGELAKELESLNDLADQFLESGAEPETAADAKSDARLYEAFNEALAVAATFSETNTGGLNSLAERAAELASECERLASELENPSDTDDDGDWEPPSAPMSDAFDVAAVFSDF